MVELDETAIRIALERALGRSLDLALAREPLAESELTRGELATLSTLASPRRREEWLTGRRALKRVLTEDRDTSLVRMPDPEVTLAHSRGWAIAVAARGCAGIGVDLQFEPGPRPRAEKFFLTAPERAWLSARPDGHQQKERLRLWTLKEALLKSDPDNAGRTYGQYALGDPSRSQGREGPLSWASIEVKDGWVSLVLRDTSAGTGVNPRG
jgi:4'-phosphopantetheinyl transferase EntD